MPEALVEALSARSRFGKEEKSKKERRRRNADRRVRNGRIQRDAARAEAQRVRLTAFYRGTYGSERTPPLNSSSRPSWDLASSGVTCI